MTAQAGVPARVRPVIDWLPGLALAAAVAVVARLLGAGWLPQPGETVLALLLGLIVGSLFPWPQWLQPGLRIAVVRVLRIGIVLLGARLSAAVVIDEGAAVVVLAAVLIAAALGLALLAGRLARLPLPLALLIAVGTAICGNSAILATAPIIDADQRHVSIAITTITAFGLLAVILYPLIGHSLGLADATYGRWAGLAVNDTSQVTAAALAYSRPAADIAIVVKLVRNTMLAPVLLVMAWAWARQGRESRPGGVAARVRDAVPLFVLGFLAMAGLNSLGLLDATLGGRTLSAWSADIAVALILVAIAAIGLATRVSSLLGIGVRALAVGLLCSVVISATAFVLVAVSSGFWQ